MRRILFNSSEMWSSRISLRDNVCDMMKPMMIAYNTPILKENELKNDSCSKPAYGITNTNSRLKTVRLSNRIDVLRYTLKKLRDFMKKLSLLLPSQRFLKSRF